MTAPDPAVCDRPDHCFGHEAPGDGVSALGAAWGDADFAEPYADLCPVDQALRAAAAADLKADALAAIYTVELGDRDELDRLLSWIDDPVIWPPVTT